MKKDWEDYEVKLGRWGKQGAKIADVVVITTIIDGGLQTTYIPLVQYRRTFSRFSDGSPTASQYLSFWWKR